jgi:hypothetical protein
MDAALSMRNEAGSLPVECAIDGETDEPERYRIRLFIYRFRWQCNSRISVFVLGFVSLVRIMSRWSEKLGGCLQSSLM